MIQPKSQFAGNLAENQKISDIFLATQKILALGKSNQPYLKITLSDSSGQIECRAWQDAERLDKLFAKGDIVSIKGRVSLYQGTPQINIDSLTKLSESETAGLSWGDFLPTAERAIDEMWNELIAHIAFIKNPYLKALLNSFTEDSSFQEKFRNSSAARGIHHVYLGGLLEHTLNVVKLATAIGPFYPLNQEILIAGAFLHDIGKIKELSYVAGFDYTVEGQLLGHITLGVQMATEKAAKIPGFPEALLLHLNHMILSHHGEYDWGSPKRPKSLEALMLHAIDNLDAKMTTVGELINKAEGNSDDWTGYSKALGRCFYRHKLSGEEMGDEMEPNWPNADTADEIKPSFTGESFPLHTETPAAAAPANIDKTQNKSKEKEKITPKFIGQGELGF